MMDATAVQERKSDVYEKMHWSFAAMIKSLMRTVDIGSSDGELSKLVFDGMM